MYQRALKYLVVTLVNVQISIEKGSGNRVSETELGPIIEKALHKHQLKNVMSSMSAGVDLSAGGAFTLDFLSGLDEILSKISHFKPEVELDSSSIANMGGIGHITDGKSSQNTVKSSSTAKFMDASSTLQTTDNSSSDANTNLPVVQ